jgi:hypothetical protein
MILKLRRFLLKNSIKYNFNKKLKNLDKKLFQFKKNKKKQWRPSRNKKENKK